MGFNATEFRGVWYCSVALYSNIFNSINPIPILVSVPERLLAADDAWHRLVNPIQGFQSDKERGKEVGSCSIVYNCINIS